ncbi:MAG: hypothetical protein K2H10_06770 [Bacteroidales bacterium]|nr:hypothetical protein [Bacteroidales bacterium]
MAEEKAASGRAAKRVSDNASQGTSWKTSQENAKEKPRKLTYKEQRELEQIEKDLEALGKEKAAIEESLNSGSLPYEELQKASERIGEIISLTEEKEMRWLELSM